MFVLIMAAALQTVPPIAGELGEVVRPPELQAQIAAHPERLENARWTDAPWPNAEWPRAAWEASIEGEATLSCVVEITGVARTCAAIAETPEHSGFGEAALSVFREFRWQPALFNGEPVESRVQFRIPFTFGPTVKSGPDLRQVMTAITAAGYATGACRRFRDPTTVARWDALQTAIDEHPTADYRFYDHVFVDGYVRGRTFAAEHEAPTATRCDEIQRWADDLKTAALPALQKLDARFPPDDRGQFRPEAE